MVFLFFGCGVLEKFLGLFRNWYPDMIFGISPSGFRFLFGN